MAAPPIDPRPAGRSFGRRLFAPAPVGGMGLGYRLLRLRLFPAVLFCTPALLVLAWYLGRAVQAHQEHAKAVDVRQPLTLELLHLHLHDLLERDLARLGREPSRPARVPTFELFLARWDGETARVAWTEPGAPPTEPLEARVRVDDERKRAARDRNRAVYKIDLEGGHRIEGHETLRLTRTLAPLPAWDQAVAAIARELGVMTPFRRHARLFVGGAPLGLHTAEARPDEAMLRQARRVPWHLFTSEGGRWKQEIELPDDPGGKAAGLRELEPLMAVVRDGSAAEVANFARRHIDLASFAAVDALGVVFGLAEGSFDRSQGIYFDPYRARFTAVGAAFPERPLLVRLRQVPEYLALRDTLVRRLVHGDAAPAAFAARLRAETEVLTEAQAADPVWAAHRPLPGAGPYFAELVRPMTRQRQQEILATRLAEHTRRVEALALRPEELRGDGLVAERRAVVLGPGVVEVAETRVFESDETVTVAPGTTLRLAEGASLVVFGLLRAEGEAQAPIRFTGAGGTWGGVVLQGPATAGSRLRHVVFEGGTRTSYSIGRYPAALSIHDTRDVRVEDADFSRSSGGDDALHAAYVEGLTIARARFRAVASDAIDLEVSSGRIEDLTVAGAGDECIDLSGTHLEVKHARLEGCAGSGVSAGEESQVRLEDVVISGGREGIHAKNASVVDGDRVLLRELELALRVDTRSRFYAGVSRFQGTRVRVLDSGGWSGGFDAWWTEASAGEEVRP